MIEMKIPSLGQKGVLLFVALGLVVMLGISFWDRVSNPELMVPGRDSGMGEGRGSMPGEAAMNPDVAKLMEHLRDNPNDVQALVHLSEHLVNDQNWAAAETFIRRAVIAAPDNAQPMYLLGVVQHNLGQHKEAAESLERVVRLKDEASVRYSLGVLYVYYLQDIPKGVAHLSAGLNDPKAPEALKKSIREELEKVPLPGAPAQKK